METPVGRSPPTVSIVIPVLDDDVELVRLLAELDELSHLLNVSPEVIVVDGGSQHDSPDVTQRNGVKVVTTLANRGLQLDEGARKTTGSWIWFLHADTALDAQPLRYLHELREPGWGRFDIQIGSTSTSTSTSKSTSTSSLLRLVAWFMNQRSRLTGISTGDQGIFVHRTLLLSIGGVPRQPLMEDIELSKRLRKLSPPLAPLISVMTSARRWERRGTMRSIVSMWHFRWRYWRGADPEVLAREYYG